MKFFAFVKPKSKLDRRWHAISLQAGLHLGMTWRRNDLSGRYETDELTADEVVKIQALQSQEIVLEAIHSLPLAPEQAEALAQPIKPAIG